MILALLPAALATSGFDASTPDATFTDAETYDNAAEYKLWSVIERLHDPDADLFEAGEYNSTTAWPESADYAPHIADCFGTQTPDTSDALLHVGPSAALAYGTPILFVPGAGDNASRGFVTMAWHEDLLYRPVYALTFAHPHGDVFEQAELVADAIARIEARTGATQVDVVSHSKGGAAVAVYLSNYDGASWSDAAYQAAGTKYRGDVRRAVFIASPLDGVDTSYRWPSSNYLSLDADTAFSPSAWQKYYPYGTAVPGVWTDLSEQDFFADGGDLFPGQRQLLRNHEDEYPLPGSLPWLGAYSVQQDWYTTYEGGTGFVSSGEGIDAAVDAAGDVLTQIAHNGVDPGVELFTLAGDNPLMPNGTSDWIASTYGDSWAEVPASVETWAEIVADLVGDGLMSEGLTEEEVQGLADGDLMLGEVSGPSDGLVFVSSATFADELTGRGAEVVESKTVNLSHLDLLYASPITGELMIETAAENPEQAWYASFGERYIEADTIGWVEQVLADDTGGGDSGDSGGAVDTDTGGGEVDSGGGGGGGVDGSGENPEEGSETPTGCGACNGVPGAAPWLGLFALGLVRRRSAVATGATRV